LEEEFIKRVTDLLKDEHEEYRKRNSLVRKKMPSSETGIRRGYLKKYYQTENGVYACSKRNATRIGKFKEASVDLHWEERKLIGRFYKNCPVGYEVDHIIPISKNGKHILSNLQYLTKSDNRKKHAKLDWKPETYD